MLATYGCTTIEAVNPGRPCGQRDGGSRRQPRHDPQPRGGHVEFLALAPSAASPTIPCATFGTSREWPRAPRPTRGRSRTQSCWRCLPARRAAPGPRAPRRDAHPGLVRNAGPRAIQPARSRLPDGRFDIRASKTQAGVRRVPLQCRCRPCGDPPRRQGAGRIPDRRSGTGQRAALWGLREGLRAIPPDLRRASDDEGRQSAVTLHTFRAWFASAIRAEHDAGWPPHCWGMPSAAPPISPTPSSRRAVDCRCGGCAAADNRFVSCGSRRSVRSIDAPNEVDIPPRYEL